MITAFGLEKSDLGKNRFNTAVSMHYVAYHGLLWCVKTFIYGKCNVNRISSVTTWVLLLCWWGPAGGDVLGHLMYVCERYVCIKGSGTFPCTLLSIYKKPRETQVHNQGRCVLLRLLYQPFREIFKETDKRFYNCITICKRQGSSRPLISTPILQGNWNPFGGSSCWLIWQYIMKRMLT